MQQDLNASINYFTVGKEPKDPELWKIAKKRADFKNHLTIYVVMNIFFWAVWFFTDQQYSENEKFPWPVWQMFGWGIGVFFHYVGTYVYPKNNLAEREYQKLILINYNSNK